MKKFAETVNKNGGVFLEARHRGKTTYEIQGLTSSPLIIFGDWISPEDHQAEIEKLKSQLEKQQPEIREVPQFEEEFDNLIRAFVEYHDCSDFDTEKCYLELEKEFIEKYGKKHQPEIPEVPQFVAELIKKRKGNWSLFGAFRNISGNKYDNEKLYEWVFAHAGRQEIFAQAWLNGYTVKEKRFYLKNKLTDLYLAIDESTGKYVEIEEKWLEKRRVTSYKPIFPQQEIDSMAADSYEQIEVEEKQ